MTEQSLIYITTPSEEEAGKIAESIIESRLAACANILPGMKSMYWWEGEVQSGAEVVLIFKTRAELVDSLTKAVQKLHSYECPCIVAVPIAQGNPAFLEWIRTQTQ